MTLAKTALLLVCSNVFMTFAWYAHLRNLRARPLIVAVLVSWGIAFFEYLLQVPANRIGFASLSLSQLKILQEVITLTVFVPFAHPLHEAAHQARLPLGGAVPDGGRVFRLSFLNPSNPPSPALGPATARQARRTSCRRRAIVRRNWGVTLLEWVCL